MIDPTNIPATLDQAGAAVQAGKTFWQENGTVILVAALWLRAELVKIIIFIESRGGVGRMLLNLIWVPARGAIVPESRPPTLNSKPPTEQ